MHGTKSTKHHSTLKSAANHSHDHDQLSKADSDYEHFKSYGKNKNNLNAMSDVEKQILDWQEEMSYIKK
ncbi:MAG: hypothetical protein Q7V02_07770 [Methylophilus sp.]|nr:hypothetical protein [Methylophilus sp.]